MSTAPATVAVGDAVATPDSVMHAVTALAGEGVEVACGLLVLAPKIVGVGDTVTPCLDCLNGTTAPVETPLSSLADPAFLARAANAELEEPSTEAEAATPKAKRTTKAERAAAKLEAERLQVLANTPQADEEPTPVTASTNVANQPTKAATDSKVVGFYSLEQPKKAGAYRLRDSRDGKLAPEAFDLLGDAAWFAQRRTRLAQYAGFGGSRHLHMPKVPGNVGPYTICGELGKVEVQRDGERVGPVWTHKANGKVDAMRWAERLLRPTRATA